MGTFRVKIPSDLRHIVAKKAPGAVLARGPLMLAVENQRFLIFAYLRASADAVENIRFSVLKFSGGLQLLRAAAGVRLRLEVVVDRRHDAHLLDLRRVLVAVGDGEEALRGVLYLAQAAVGVFGKFFGGLAGEAC